MAKNSQTLENTKRLMGALGRMPPKPHDQMKLGKATGKKKASPKRKVRSTRPAKI